MFSVAGAGVFLYFYISTKPLSSPRSGVSFWLVVGGPLLLAYCLRAALPDHSYDVWAYHILHSDRSLHGALYRPGDYFPAALPFNPVADMLTGLSRLALGYRLGTIINLFVLLRAAQIIDRILRAFINGPWLRHAAVLLILLTENVLFEISTYMVDLLALPLLLQATFLALNLDQARTRVIGLSHIAMFLGAGMAFKFTNFAVAVPLLVFCGLRMTLGAYRFSPKRVATTSLIMMVVFVAPILPFTIYIYRLTGNPVFPIANTFFQSPFWPTHGGWDARWGPESFWQTIAWPVLAWFKPERHSELAVYSGRLSLAFIVAVVFLPLLWRKRQVRILCIFLITSALLWAFAGMGYSRYGVFEDVLGGVTLCAVASVLGVSLKHLSWRTAGALGISAVFIVQSYFACRYALSREWGDRSTLISAPALHAKEAALMLRDHSLKSFLTDEQKARFDKVQVWFESCPKSTAFEVLLNPGAPVIALRQPELFQTREAWQQFIRKVEATGGQNMYSLCLSSDLNDAKRAIRERGLELGEVVPINLPFFSPRNQIGMMLLEIRLPQSREVQQKAAGPLPDSGFKAEIIVLHAPERLRPGQVSVINIKVKNNSDVFWWQRGGETTDRTDNKFYIAAGNKWVHKNGMMTSETEGHNGIPKDLKRGEEIEMSLKITAPGKPGEWIMELDMVQEGVAWFHEKGSPTTRVKVQVVN